jgi:hypothetical protein
MNPIYLTPYSIIENKDYPVDTKIVIRASDFNGIPFQDGKITFSFINCKFRKLEIENNETIDFKDISIQFISCFITEINVETFTTTNFSIFFGSSILQGRIKNSNLLSVTVNNCLLNNSLFLLNLNKAVVSYTEENIFPIRWKKLLKSVKTDLKTLLEEKHSYYIYDTKNIVFSFNENATETRGIYKRPYSNEVENKIGYYFTDEEKKKFKLSLSLQYSADIEHKLTKIVNAKLSALSISGYSTGELIIESAKIDNWYIHNFSTQIGSNFYNIKPFRNELTDKKLEIHKSNLDKVWFDNVSFNDFSIISFYRNKFGQTTITSCEFPDNYKGFDKFKTVENIHYPDRLDENYYKTRYETFLQLKKLLESSGNFYEAQKLQAVSNEALRKISNLPFWDRLILKINSLSNNHGLSIKEPFFGTLILCAIFYVLYLWSLGRMFNSNGIDLDLIGYYFAFLDITHRCDFLVSKEELSGLSLTIDYVNKIFVGFLIYQFIAAFRKYGKK